MAAVKPNKGQRVIFQDARSGRIMNGWYRGRHPTRKGYMIVAVPSGSVRRRVAVADWQLKGIVAGEIDDGTDGSNGNESGDSMASSY